MDPNLWELFEGGNSEDEVPAIIRLSRPDRVPEGVRLVAQFGDIATCRLRRGSILTVRANPETVSLKASTGLAVEESIDPGITLEDFSARYPWVDERRPPSLAESGRGVIVGIVDAGFDFAHPDFRHDDGKTRILALWDQRHDSAQGAVHPYHYGTIHTAEAINRALASQDPYSELGYHPADADPGHGAHGTHVTSIAAGNGAGGGPIGIAPDADLVLVDMTTLGSSKPLNLGDSVTLLEAIDFIAQTAGDRPWVINLSMGGTGQQHDGTTLVEQALDAVVRARPGRAICNSTGNYFNQKLHAFEQLLPTQQKTFVWEVSSIDIVPNKLEIWYSGRDTFSVTVCSPDRKVVQRVGLNERATLQIEGQAIGAIYHRAHDPNNLDNHVQIFLYSNAPGGSWSVTVTAEDLLDGRVHCWIERDTPQSHFRVDDAASSSTTGSICNGQRTIAVGAYNPHSPEHEVASFSSGGPTRDGRLKPDLCAPGVFILAARSAPREPGDAPPLLTRMSGTSMACPHVTGTIALMFEAARRPLRIEETHNLLLASARKVSMSEETINRVGSGYLDIEQAVESARHVGSIGPGPRLKHAGENEAVEMGCEKETIEMHEDQEIEMIEFVEGKAEDEVEEAVDWQNTFHRIAADITGAFEGGKPGTLNLYDLGIISYGKHQATLASGTLYPILKRYTELSSSETAKSMAAYLERVKQKDETLREDKDFIQLLKDAAKEPEMSRAQDEEFARQYWEPSKKAAQEAGIKSALGYVLLYDTRVQGGMQYDLKNTQKRLGGKVGDTMSGRQITEQEFLRVFVEERIKRNLRISANQKKQAEELNNEAQALEDAAAANPDRASELRGQAAEKRKKAKRYAANAAALEISANKTRGPSLMALVASGDLDLFGDADGKIYLTGKPGITITGLKPGATIDAITPTEQADQLEIEPIHQSAELEEEAFAPAEATEVASAELVKLADQVIAELAATGTPPSILRHVLPRSGLTEKVTLPGNGQLPSAAAIFDAFAYSGPRSDALRRHLEEYFMVVALPRTPLESELRKGDLLIRRGEGGQGYVAVIAAPHQWSYEELPAAGLLPETLRTGQFVQVVEGGVRPHPLSDAFARRVADEQGMVDYDTLILRMHGIAGENVTETSGSLPEESTRGPCPDVPVPPGERPQVLVWGSTHSAVREAQRKLNAFHAFRLAAGLPGLRDAPLVEDCIIGKHTFEAVKSFQELVFPGMPKEHDSKIGPHTWTQLDAIVVGPGPSPVAQLTVELIRITDDAFTGPLSWDQVIGLDTPTFNLEIIASGLPPATMPSQIRVELSSRVPNGASGLATLSVPITRDVPLVGNIDPTNPNRIFYRTKRSLTDIGDFLKVERVIKEVTTIVRSGGTSDVEFRRTLGWNPRGIATQPIVLGTSTGSEAGEIPDAFTLFRSAGVEVLEVRVPALPNWIVPGPIKRLIRNPADVVYYSGHGSSGSGKLLIDIENKPCPEHGTYSNWLGAADLAPAWKSPMDLDVLIIAGCSVLKIDFSTSPVSGPGLAWTGLLSAKGGPLVALLGYQGAAPCDKPNGEWIARGMAERMAKGSTDFARDWLEINGDNHANNAVAIDARGYWWIEKPLIGSYHINGPRPIP